MRQMEFESLLVIIQLKMCGRFALSGCQEFDVCLVMDQFQRVSVIGY